MKVFNNVTDILRDDMASTIAKGSKVSIAAACFSMYAYNELKKQLEGIDEFRFIFTSPTFITEKAEKQKREFYIPRLNREHSLYGTEFELKLRNEMTQKAVARECAEWIRKKATFKSNTTGNNMGGFATVEALQESVAYMPLNGFTTVDIGCERGNNSYNMVNRMETPFAEQYMQLFETIWNDKTQLQDVTDVVIENISTAYNENSPEFIYFITLYNVFSEFLEDISEDVLPNEATGFKSSKIWDMLYDFQKDAVLAIINKLEKYNGCILADSVGLGKTFTALAVIKYYENRNRTVLVLCPKKLAENWNTYKDNYVNNPIATDRLNYDVLFHTDLSREHGTSNGLDLDRLNWGNYDLVVIDESHNFRNGGEVSGEDNKENRYLKLMNRIIRAGVKTKVLMLSATPVNNRFIDLKNQLAIAYEGDSEQINERLDTAKPIDEIFRQAQKVAKYKQYDAAGQPQNGVYADIFEEEYNNIINNLQLQIGEDDYIKYLKSIPMHKTHAGYFSVDKKGKMIDSKVGRKETTSDDIDAYDLIMKNKELLLDRNPKKSPVRFIFSHSALREGWDNPNVFQICTLKQSGSDVRKRQEVGRGLRLCVNQDGERMDSNALGNDVHNVNVLTVVASESYDSFAKGLQSELADAVADRPRAVTAELFIGKVIKDSKGNEQVVDTDTAQAIHYDMIVNGYIDRKGVLTDKYYADKANNEVKVAEEVADSAADVIAIVDSIYDSKSMQPENARSNNVELQVNPDKLAMPEFKALWKRINGKSVYVVDFDTDELVRKSIASLDAHLRVSKIFFKVETGRMDDIKSKDALLSGASFVKGESAAYGTGTKIAVNRGVKYDLVGKLVDETGLTRKAVIAILTGIQPSVFDQFKDNPEEFILKAAALINDEKATAIIQHITYDVLDEHYDTDVFTDPTIKGKLGVNAMKAKKHLYDHIVYDSSNERDFATELDTNTDVAVYVKLPYGFYISTPVGHYNPDWAIAFYEGTVKHIYFAAETKGSMSSMQLRLIEESKIHCAREHFKAISNGNVIYDVVDSYQSLLDKVMK